MIFASNSSGQPCARRHDARALCLLIALVILVAACSESDGLPATSGYSPEVVQQIETPFPKLTELLRSVPVAVIDLDDLPEPIAIEPEVIIGGEPVTDSDTLFLAHPHDAVIVGDSIVIFDRGHVALFVTDMEGRLVRRVGRGGQAPGEFSEFGDLAANDDHVFVCDPDGRRMQVFDHLLRYQTSFPATYIPLVPQMATSAEKLYVPNIPSSAWGISVYDAAPPFAHETDLFPQIVALENPRRGHNRVTIAANNAGAICGNYLGLPYILCYDEDHNPSFAFAFQGERVRRLDRGLPDGAQMTGSGVPIREFTRAMIMVDRVLYLLLGRSMVAIDLEVSRLTGAFSLPDGVSGLSFSSTKEHFVLTDHWSPEVWLFSHDYVHSQLTGTD